MARRAVDPSPAPDLLTHLEPLAIADLRPHPRNDGTHPPAELDHLRASIREHTIYRNVVIAQDGTLLAGHGVVEAARLEGHTHVPGYRLPYGPDDPRALKLLVGDNHMARLREQDDAALAALLSEIAVDGAEGLLGTGFDAASMQVLLDSVSSGNGEAETGAGWDVEPEINRAEELREQWGVEVGQLWLLGAHRIVCGDCTEKTVVERLMQGEQVAMVLTSPPYALGKEYERDVSFDEHLSLLRTCADRCLEIVVPGGFLFLNFGEIAPQSHPGPLTGSDRQCLYPISKDYWQIFHEERRCDLYAQRIWYKPFNRLQQPFWTYHTSIPHHQEWEHLWTWRTPGGDGDTVYDWDVSVRAVWDTRTESTDDRPLTRHTAAFPVGIPERALRAHTAPHALIYDPFLGSGTTLVACHNLSRICRGAESNPGYVAVTLQRWADLTHQTPVLIR